MRRVLLALIAIGVLVVLGTGGSASSGKEKGHLVKQAAQGTLQAATLSVTRNEVTTNRPMPFLSGSTINAAQDALCAENGVANCDERAEAADSGTAVDLGMGDIGISQGTLGCSKRDNGAVGAGNVRVNQDCSFRRQAEEEINYSPADPQTSLPVRTTAASASTSAASIGRPTTATSGATSCRRSARRSTTPPARSLWLAIRTVTRSTRVLGPATPTTPHQKRRAR